MQANIAIRDIAPTKLFLLNMQLFMKAETPSGLSAVNVKTGELKTFDAGSMAQSVLGYKISLMGVEQ